MTDYPRMKLKRKQSACAHYVFPAYPGAPFVEALCGYEKLAEEWEDAPDDMRMHYTCEIARAKRERKAA